ncbi:MATE family efflux transporter [Govanella unica]|uniref:Multidrug-efflux transporter n=1 Tax=Govanella unica TaxID=2975056 RepID=A0A9X3U0F4_9PROT|nr:MATE family efflux transporter [Govania unica]MDA5195103.1 MATE family efflux transporter [Govania unica]
MTFFDHAKRTLSLALPMMLAQGLSLAAYIIDTVMVGQAGGEELAFLSTGRAVVLVVIMVGIGLLNGVIVLTARADGAGDPMLCGRLWKSGLIYAGLLGACAVLAISFGGGPALAAVGLAPDLVVGGGRYLAYMGFAIPGTYFFVCSNFFLQGLSRPKPGMVAMLLATPLNIGLNLIMIYGYWGFPAMGAAGAALATAISQWSAALGLFLYIRGMKDRSRFGIGSGTLSLRALWHDGARVRYFGFPLGVASGLEFLGSTANIMFAGLIGAVTLSGLEVVYNMHLLAFIVCFSIASATSVRVGNAVGAQRLGDIPRIVPTGVSLAFLSMLPFALAYALLPGPFFSLFTPDLKIHAMARLMLPFILVALFFDAMQFVLLHSLRAAGDQWTASILQVTAFLLVMVPAAWILAFPAGFGGPGIAASFAIGSSTAAVLLGGRFALLARRNAFRQSTDIKT